MSRPVLPAPSYDKETAAAFNAILDRVLRDNPELQKLVTYVEEEGGTFTPVCKPSAMVAILRKLPVQNEEQRENMRILCRNYLGAELD